MDSLTLIVLPRVYKTIKNACADVRVGCSVCTCGVATTCHVKYTCSPMKVSSIPIVLNEQYHDVFVCYNPPIDVVYYLRNMIRDIYAKVKPIIGEGYGIAALKLDSEHYKDYYGPGDHATAEDFADYYVGYVECDRISLCRGCYMMLAALQPDYLKLFIQTSIETLARLQWVQQHRNKITLL